MRILLALSASLLIATPGVLHAAGEATLRGSPAAMREQNRIAKEAGLDSYRTPAQIRAAAEKGDLVPLQGSENYEMAHVSFPYVNAAVALFVERIGEQYHGACGEKLVVTSGTRPMSQQPSNAHELSVHPMGMAVDFRVSSRESCRNWLESSLLSLESKGLLNATREYRPPHYHVAIFPPQYLAYADSMMLQEETARAEAESLALTKLATVSTALVQTEKAPLPAQDDRTAGVFLVVGTLLVVGGLSVNSLRKSLVR